jgi:hypothetical protein
MAEYDEEIDLEEAKKDELVEEAEARGLDTSGTKAELVERILESDSGGNSLDYGVVKQEEDEDA